MSAPTDPMSRTTTVGGVPTPRTEADLTTDLLLLEDLEDAERTKELAEADLNALRAVADWIKAFVVRPHEDLGRSGTVCPFVPGSLERRSLWLAPERIAERDVPQVVELMNRYKSRLLKAGPTDGDAAIYDVIVVVFPDLPADRAQGVLDGVLQALAVTSGRTTRATRRPRYTTRTSDRSSHPCRSCSCGMAWSATGSSSSTTRTGSTCGCTAMEKPQPTPSPSHCAGCPGGRGAIESSAG